jgi:hypothetical protein
MRKAAAKEIEKLTSMHDDIEEHFIGELSMVVGEQYYQLKVELNIRLARFTNLGGRLPQMKSQCSS